MIDFVNVSKVFGNGRHEVHAVEDVSLSIEKGEISVENLPDTGCKFTVTLKTK